MVFSCDFPFCGIKAIQLKISWAYLYKYLTDQNFSHLPYFLQVMWENVFPQPVLQNSRSILKLHWLNLQDQRFGAK